MTQSQAFAADLDRLNAAIEAAGALIDFGDGTYGIDSAKVSATVLGTYNRLLQYGYANGLI